MRKQAVHNTENPSLRFQH